MYRKPFFILFIAIGLLVLAASSAPAQTAPVRGRVMLKQADGTEVPVANAVLDFYRLDLPGKIENVKANKRGEFQALGLYVVGKYIIAASGPNARPKVRGSVKAGLAEEYVITLEPGDGRRLTMDEAKQLAEGASSGGGGESAEDRAKREELERKNAEILAGNKKIEEINATVNRTFAAGGKALQAKNYEEAITQYSEGLAADPEQPALLTNKSVALRMRGAERYNAAIQSKDEAAKTAGLEASRKDFREAAEAGTKAVTLLKALPASTDQSEQQRQKANLNAAIIARAEAMKIFVPKVDPAKAEEGLAAFQEYEAIQTDPAAKLNVQLAAAQMVFDAGVSDKAVAAYQKILEAHPDNVDAMLGAGLALYGTQDESKYQEAANFLQRFVDKAPDSNAFKAGAKEVLEELKKQNVKPQKPATGRRRG